MSSATAIAKPAPALDVDRLCADFTESYLPANAHERMLVTNLAECWIRVQRARDAERRFFEGRDLLELIDANQEKYKLITRYVTDCERGWRHAVHELETTQRRRLRAEKRAETNDRRRPARPQADVPLPSMPLRAAVAATSRRE